MASNFDYFAENYDSIVYNALERSLMMQQEVNNYEEISDSLTDILFNYDVRVHFYGSRVIGIANPNSDLDIFIDVQGGPNLANKSAYYHGRSQQEQINVLQTLEASFFRSRFWNVEKSGILYNATVPIIYACYRRDGRELHCEIAVKDGRSVATTKLLRHFFSIQPEAKKLFHFVRIWLETSGIKLKGYQVTLLVIFYLQNINFMPSVERVQRNIPHEEICGWPVEFNPHYNLCDYGCRKLRNYRGWLSGFFRFYAEFNYDDDVMFLNFGCTVDKTDYPDQPCLQHFNEDIALFRWDKPMAMAGPFSLDNNVTLSVGQRKLNNFIRICESADNTLDYYQIG